MIGYESYISSIPRSRYFALRFIGINTLQFALRVAVVAAAIEWVLS